MCVPLDRGHLTKEPTVLHYPGHWAGLGLLLLRGTVGITVAVKAWLFIASTHGDLVVAIPAAALIVCGVGLTVGIFTPVCSTLAAVAYAFVMFTPFGGAAVPRLDCAAAMIGLAATIALAFLGPGALSIDARLFGRRAIFIPANDGSEQS